MLKSQTSRKAPQLFRQVLKNALMTPIAMISCVCLLFMALAPAARAGHTKELYKQGNEAQKKGDYDLAISCWNAVLRKHPDDAIAYYNRGLAYDSKGDNDNAVSDYSDAIRLDPTDPDFFNNRGLIYQSRKDYSRAIADYNSAMRVDPKFAFAYYNRGNAYSEQGDTDKAIADYCEAIKRDPKNPDFYNNRGLVYNNKGDYDKALADYNQALQLTPSDAVVLRNRGNTYNSKGDFGKAAADYNEAIHCDPKSPDPYASAAWLYATCPSKEIRDGAKAVELAAKACELSEWKDWDVIDTLAAAEAEAHDFDKAVKFENQAIALAEKADEDTEDLKDRLALYRKQKPYRDIKE